MQHAGVCICNIIYAISSTNYYYYYYYILCIIYTADELRDKLQAE
jgi:hypothetical protein